MPPKTKVCICVCTFRRPEGLVDIIAAVGPVLRATTTAMGRQCIATGTALFARSTGIHALESAR